MLAADAGELFLSVNQKQEPSSFESRFVFGAGRAAPDSLKNGPRGRDAPGLDPRMLGLRYPMEVNLLGTNTVIHAALSAGDNPLTDREREVLAAALDGASIADLATRLALSEGTVRNHLSAAIQKLGVRNRLEAARRAEEQGWL
jgi:DNA-binding CsgD family transcriptional regulator